MNSTHFLYSYVAMHSLVYIPILSKCGDIASFIFFGFCQSLYLVNEINSTLSFIIKPTAKEFYGSN